MKSFAKSGLTNANIDCAVVFLIAEIFCLVLGDDFFLGTLKLMTMSRCGAAPVSIGDRKIPLIVFGRSALLVAKKKPVPFKQRRMIKPKS
jgi:hypothetical protein